MAVNIQLRRGTAAEWTAANPTLAVGEIGIETDTDQFKIGNGSDDWDTRPYGGLQGTDGADGTDGTDGVDGGFDSTQTIEDKSTSYAILSADKGKLITNSAAVTITIDNVLSAGEQIDFLQNSADQITFAAGSGVTLNSKDGNLKTAAQYSPASVKCISSGVYVLLGDLGA